MAKSRSIPTVEEILKRRNQSPVTPDAGALQAKVVELEAEIQRMRFVEQQKPTRHKLFGDLMTIFKEYGIEPVEELIKMARDGDLTNDQRIKVWTELAAYKHPKLKSVEMTGSVDMNFTIVVRKFGEAIDCGSPIIQVPSTVVKSEEIAEAEEES